MSARDRTRTDGRTFDYVECRDCGALQIDTIPADLEQAYGDDYYTERQRTIRTSRSRIGRALRHGSSRLRLGIRPDGLARLVSGRRYGRFDWFRRTRTGLSDPILDVGCGSGRLLFRLHAEGFRTLVGIDPRLSGETADRARRCPGLRFERVTPEDHRGLYRLVMAHHSFEHMPDPLRSFEALAGLVAPGGSLLLRVPIADSWARTHYGADWAQLDAPRHLQIPTRASIERLAARTGLHVESVVDDSGVFQIWGSERSLPRGGAARFLRWLLARRQAARLRRAGRGDQAAFYLRRLT